MGAGIQRTFKDTRSLEGDMRNWRRWGDKGDLGETEPEIKRSLKAKE